jgi:hypothetical protein
MRVIPKVIALIVAAAIVAVAYLLIGGGYIFPSISVNTYPSQIINGSLGNNVNANYSYQNKLAENITKKYNETINNTIPFTGDSTNKLVQTNAEQQFLVSNMNYSVIKYNNFYIPISFNISDDYFNNSNYFPSLIGKTVYLEFIDKDFDNKTFVAPYTVQSEKIIGPKVFWYLTQATGVSNSTAINFNTHINNSTILKGTTGLIIGIYYNGTEILFPRG